MRRECTARNSCLVEYSIIEYSITGRVRRQQQAARWRQVWPLAARVLALALTLCPYQWQQLQRQVTAGRPFILMKYALNDHTVYQIIRVQQGHPLYRLRYHSFERRQPILRVWI